jgi:TorA maturation chaperone TorD
MISCIIQQKEARDHLTSGYLASCLRHFAQICSASQTSDTHETLSAIAADDELNQKTGRNMKDIISVPFMIIQPIDI